MHDRRRAARLISLLMAALAVAGTSATPPSPGPTQQLDLTGSLSITADRPVAVQPFDLVVAAGNLDSMTFVPVIGPTPAEGSFILSFEAAEEAIARGTGGVSQGADGSVTWSFSCRTNPCGARYALVVTWLGAPKGASTDITWRLGATATYLRGSGAAPTPGRVTLTAAEAGKPASVSLSRATGGQNARLTEPDRQRRWAVTLVREGPAVPAEAWPAISQARLSVAATQVAGPPFAAGVEQKDRRLANRSDPPVHVRVWEANGATWTRSAGDEPATFDPFGGCRDERCTATLAIALVWADGRPDTAFDATWDLDLAAISIGGQPAEIVSTVQELALPGLATAAGAGSFEISRDGRGQDGARFTALAPALDPARVTELRRSIPSRALATVKVTSVGPTPFPAGATISIQGSGGEADLWTAVELPIGAEGSFAFEPRATCRDGQPGECTLTGVLSANFATPNRNQVADGMIARIEWTLEVGIGTAAGGEATLTVEPQPTSPP